MRVAVGRDCGCSDVQADTHEEGKMPCPLCGDPQATAPSGRTDPLDITCPTCGHYRITLEAHGARQFDPKLAFVSASWVYEQAQQGVAPLVDLDTISWIRSRPPTTMKRRAEAYLAAIIKILSGNLMGDFKSDDSRLRVASGCSEVRDCIALSVQPNTMGNT